MSLRSRVKFCSFMAPGNKGVLSFFVLSKLYLFVRGLLETGAFVERFSRGKFSPRSSVLSCDIRECNLETGDQQF